MPPAPVPCGAVIAAVAAAAGDDADPLQRPACMHATISHVISNSLRPCFPGPAQLSMRPTWFSVPCKPSWNKGSVAWRVAGGSRSSTAIRDWRARRRHNSVLIACPGRPLMPVAPDGIRSSIDSILRGAPSASGRPSRLRPPRRWRNQPQRSTPRLASPSRRNGERSPPPAPKSP